MIGPEITEADVAETVDDDEAAPRLRNVLLRTSDGVSPVVSAGEIWTTLGLFGLIYLILFIGWLRIFLGIIRKGPDDVVEMLEAEKVSAQPAPAGAGR